jgi:Cu2+-containing amine oxidase
MNRRQIRIRLLAVCVAAHGVLRVSSLTKSADTTLSRVQATAQKKKTLAQATHPLDPLTKEELKTAVSLVRAEGKLAKEALFPLVALHKPSRQELDAPGNAQPMDGGIQL